MIINFSINVYTNRLRMCHWVKQGLTKLRQEVVSKGCEENCDYLGLLEHTTEDTNRWKTFLWSLSFYIFVLYKPTGLNSTLKHCYYRIKNILFVEPKQNWSKCKESAGTRWQAGRILHLWQLTVLHNQAYQKLFYLFSQHTALEFNKTNIFLSNLTV